MSFSWADKEAQVKQIYTRIVYSDDEEFYEENSPYRIVFITKSGIHSYVLKYHTTLQTCTRYCVPHYNRTHAHLVLKDYSDPPTAQDVHNNRILVAQYQV